MRKSALLLLAATFVAVTAISAVVYANPYPSSGSTMSGDMMDRGKMGRMMGRMSRMMSGCGAMMHEDSARSDDPNEQWRGQ